MKETTYTCDLCEKDDLVHFVGVHVENGRLVKRLKRNEGDKHICMTCIVEIQKWFFGNKP